MKYHVRSLLTACATATVSLLAGCSATQPGVSPEVGSPSGAVTLEKRVFSSAARFYCSNRAWPKTWKELVEFERLTSREGQFLTGFGEPKLTSPRAILLTMTYAKEGGGARTATFIAPPYCGEVSPDPLEVSIAGGGILFRLPEKFALMKGADVRAWWKAPPYPDAAWKADDGRVIAIRFGDVELAPHQTAEFFHELSDAYEASVPSLTWRARDVRMLGDTAVLRHEFKNDSSRGKIVNVVLSASFGGYLFAITVTGPVEHAGAVLQAADHVEGSLQVRSGAKGS